MTKVSTPQPPHASTREAAAHAVRRARADRVAAAPARRLPDVRRRRRARSTSARRATCKKRVASYFQKSGHEPRIAAMIAQVARVETTVDALGRRGAAAREQPHQGARAALQHPVPRRQELSVRLPDRRPVPAAALPSRHARRKHIATSGRSRARARCARASRCCRRCSSCAPARTRCSPTARGPCMLHQIQRCTAPCVGLIGEADYHEDVQAALLFLQGKTDEVLAQLQAADGRRRAAALAVRARGAHARQDRAAAAAAVAAIRRERDGRRHRRRRRRCTSEDLFAVNVVMIRGGRHVGDRTFFPRHAESASTLKRRSSPRSSRSIMSSGRCRRRSSRRRRRRPTRWPKC